MAITKINTNDKNMLELKQQLADAELKILEQKRSIHQLNNKLEGKPTRDLLGLEEGKIYLIISSGRRITGKLVFEAKSFICYTKRQGVKYYANKMYIQLIKELTAAEHESYSKSNFDEAIE